MKLHDIENFICVAGTGSIRAAARQRGLTPPALTQSIVRLEEELHAPLVVRTTRGATLSNYGRAFLSRARLILSEIRRAGDEISQMLGDEQGCVAVGTTSSPSTLLVPGAIAQFQRDRPGVTIRIIDGMFHEHLERLRSGTLDFAIGATPVPSPLTNMIVEPLYENEIVAVAGRHNPLCGARSLADLQDAKWIGSDPAHYGASELIKEAFRARELPPPRILLQCESLSMLHVMLTQTDMVTLIPKTSIEYDPLCRSVAMIPLAEPLQRYVVNLFRLADSPLSPAAEHLADLVRRHARLLIQQRRIGAVPEDAAACPA